ncbi:SidA/IucD/PvdA family monooxygenase [Massilia scottii]|uniref:SidA/IucD/PvdA family monooxygenase n=1 Tax=Massilia scottii TaxID=3057166 RepID=UPI00279690B9|nr:SidA/IucD/PvdA family monooxygenase [Massilia sp. CCM 9029]MDQ1833123.1 SidA/IucD/PvdA family monooxygenase [Massilia sp. CCM 9029]
MASHIYNLLGIGFGPSNLALAICLEEEASLANVRFIEAQESAVWQKDMLLRGSDIQNNPIRDLVTLRNPKSHYTFINYLKENDRLLEYLNLGLEYPLRKEFANYIEWVSASFAAIVQYNTRVQSMSMTDIDGEQVWEVICHGGERLLARSVIVGSGRASNIPDLLAPLQGKNVFHLTRYLSHIAALPASCDKIGVLGASQSAVELLLDLMDRFPDKQIYSLQRGFGFRLKDTSPFSDRVYFPEFIDYFYGLKPAAKTHLSNQLRGTNYSSADGDVIHQLYVRIYEEKLHGKNRFHLLTNQAIDSAASLDSGGVTMALREVNTGETSSLELDALVLATGFLDFSAAPRGEPYPRLLATVADQLALDDNGVVAVERDYSVRLKNPAAPRLFLNGLCESSHGLGDAGSFSLVSLRAKVIADSLLAPRPAPAAAPAHPAGAQVERRAAVEA